MSKARIKTADAENNNYTIDISGYGAGLPAQCVTIDELSVGSDVNIVDYYNKSPDDALSWGKIRLLPNVGEYTYSTDKIWKTADELWMMECKASLAYGFLFSSERNKRWQEECPLYKSGIVSSITDEKYMMVYISDVGTVSCRTDYMTCDTAAFEENDVVVVKFENCCKNSLVVVGFWNEPKSCSYNFYIRPTFNGYFPTYGGERLKLENDELSETGTVRVSGNFAGLCGPFSQDVDTESEYIHLNAIVAAGINPNYEDDNNIFAHFVEVSSEEATYHYNYIFETKTWFAAGKKEFLIHGNYPENDAILHVNRIDWLRHSKILSECTKTTEIIDGEKYIVYLVDFTGLYFPAMTRTLKLYLSSYECTSCGAIETSEEAPKQYWNAVTSILASLINTFDNCEEYEQACIDETAECRAFYNKAMSDHTPEFVMLKEQICILSDEFGQNASYTPITIDTNMYVHNQFIYYPYGEDSYLICETLTTDYPSEQEYKYEMTLAPENKF